MADNIKIIELNEDIMRSNDIDSDNLRKKLKDNVSMDCDQTLIHHGEIILQ